MTVSSEQQRTPRQGEVWTWGSRRAVISSVSCDDIGIDCFGCSSGPCIKSINEFYNERRVSGSALDSVRSSPPLCTVFRGGLEVSADG